MRIDEVAETHCAIGASQMKRETAIILALVFLILGLVGTVDLKDQQAAHEHKVEVMKNETHKQ